MCQASRSDLNLDVIFTYIVHLYVLARLWLGCENRSQFHAAQALAEVMNLLHEVETLTKTLNWFHFVLWKKRGATATPWEMVWWDSSLVTLAAVKIPGWSALGLVEGRECVAPLSRTRMNARVYW